MKLSVIVGVLQMLWGILLKGSNCWYFGNYLDLIFEWVPQMIFMICTFGYMDFLIFYKWTINYQEATHKAPSIIN